jgi:hypothetical protein
VSVARDCGMVLPYEQVIQVTVKGDSRLAKIDWEVVGVPQTWHRGSFSSDSVSFIFTSTCYSKKFTFVPKLRVINVYRKQEVKSGSLQHHVVVCQKLKIQSDIVIYELYY